MKQKIVLFFLLFCLYEAEAQNVLVGSSVKLITSGNVNMVFYNMGISGTGANDFSGSNFYLRGGSNTTITTGGNFSLNNLYVDKISATAFLGSPASIANGVYMVSGLLDLNSSTLTLSPAANINGENESTHITGPNGGEIAITLNLASPNAINAGNLGAIITSASDLGTVTIRRGHQAQTGNGITNSITRYFKIIPANNTSLNATLRFVYLDAELNGQTESSLNLYNSNDNGLTWNNQLFTTRDAATNYLEKTPIASLTEYTLSSSGNALPVIGLYLSAHRLDKNRVLLNWKTIQEINNKGFFIERERENENSFAVVAFEPSHAIGGNSNVPLTYSMVDSNYFSGISFYRIRQTDFDNHFMYSAIVSVKGEVGTIHMTAWPVPSGDHLYFKVQGIRNNEMVQLLDISGKLVRQFAVKDNEVITINDLAKGAYILNLVKYATTLKVLIQ